MAGRSRIWWVVVVTLCMTSLVVSFNVDQYEGYRVLRLEPQSKHHVTKLEKFARETRSRLFFLNNPSSPHPRLDIMTSPEELVMLIRLVEYLQIPHETLIPELRAALMEHRDRVATNVIDHSQIEPFPLSQYHPMEQINGWLRKLEADHPHLVELTELGRSAEDRPITVVKLSGQHGAGDCERPAIWLDGGVHANEWITPATLIYIIHQLVTRYGEDEDVTRALDNADWYLVPVVNVDGYVYTWTQDRMWRKSRSSNNRTTCVGVDLNRNWPIEWKEQKGSSQDPCSHTYGGQYGGSEPEVQALMTFLRGLGRRLKAYVAVHSYSQLWMYPYTYTSHHDAPTACNLTGVSQLVVDAIRDVHGRDYRHGRASDLFGEASGTSIDYVYDVLGVDYAFGMELRDTGRFGHLLPPDQIVPTAEETMAGVMVLADIVIQEAHNQDCQAILLPSRG